MLFYKIYQEDRATQYGEHDTGRAVERFGACSVCKLSSDARPQQCECDAEDERQQLRRASNQKMAACTGQCGKCHDKDAGSHSCFQLVAQHTGQDQKHHHSAACTHKPADKSDDRTTYDRLDEAFSGVCGCHRFLGGHDRFYNKFDTEK